MTALNLFSDWAMTGNPVVMRPGMTAGTTSLRGISVYVSMSSTVAYLGYLTSPEDIDISEILDAAAPAIPEVPAGNTQPICCLENAQTLAERKFKVQMQSGSTSEEYSGIAWPGGLPLRFFRKMAAAGTDIFQDRFLNYKGNFFITTRSSGFRITVPETEISPLYFISDGTLDVSIVEKAGGFEYSPGKLRSGIYALDLRTLRQHFIATHNVLPSAFDVKVGGKAVCSIVIGREAPAPERYLIRYRTSFGIMENLAMTGSMTMEYSPENDDNTTFRRQDSITFGMTKGRERISSRITAKISGSVHGRRGVLRIAEMLQSPEVYLVDERGNDIGVIPSGEFSRQISPKAPQEFSVELLFRDSEDFVTDEMAPGMSVRPRIFSSQFNNVFN